jgi:hypothetical protein
VDDDRPERRDTGRREQRSRGGKRPSRQALLDEANRLYAEHGKPLEGQHWGMFLAVSPDGQTIIGEDLEAVSQEAARTFGRGSILFKIGEVAVGTIR